MGRPTKTGLQYFSFDVDFFEDEKIEAISGEFGIEGELVAIKLLCAIYRNGYYIEWSELLKMKLIRRIPGVTREVIDNIVNRLVGWGFFNKAIFESDNVLTSRGIQKRFKEATKRRSDSNIDIYNCLDVVNVYNNHATESIKVLNSTQSKVKESKGKESKEDVEGEDAGKPAPKPRPSKNHLDDRQKKFYKDLAEYVPEYGREMVRAFYDYWSEPNKSKTKMKWEMERTWDLHLRLKKWRDNDDKWSKPSNAKPLHQQKPDARAVDVHELLRQRQLEIERDKANSGHV